MIMDSYKYWLELVNAIEVYTKENIDKDKSYYLYRGLDLRFAFERQAYFEIFGNNDYFNNLDNKKVLFVSNSYTKNILKKIDFYKDINIKVKYRSKKSFLKSILYKNKNILNFYLNIKKSKLQIGSKYDNVFVIIHHKFIRYLSPIYEELDNSIFLICDDFNECMKICEENNYKYLFKKGKYKIIKNHDYLSDLYIQVEVIKYLLLNLDVKKVIIPEGNAPIYELFNIVSQSKKIKTVCIQQGWSPVYHNGFKNMHYDVFLTWGNVFSTSLSLYNKFQKFISVGNHQLHIDKRNIKKDSISFFLQGINSIITEKDFYVLIKLSVLVAINYPNRSVIIREHPSFKLKQKIKEELEKHNNIVFMNANKYSLSDVLNRSEISISIYSTVLYESLLYNTIPISFNTTSLPGLEPSLAKIGLGLEVENINQAFDEINTILDDSSKKNEILKKIELDKKKYFQDYSIMSVENIVKEIIK